MKALTNDLFFQVVQSGGKNIELAVMKKGETLKVKKMFWCGIWYLVA